MRKIRRRRRHYTNYIIIACICVFSVMGIGYGYLQQSLNIDMSLSRKETTNIGGKGVVIVSSGDGLYEDQYEDGRYIYRGSEPNNYIQFNNELWRIIAKEVDGTYKIIRDELLSKKVFDEPNYRTATNNTYCNRLIDGCGIYGAVSGTYVLGNLSGTVTEDSSIADYLNGEYYNSLTTTAKTQVQRHTFYIGGVFRLNQSGNDSIEKNLSSEKAYPWTGYIGLPNITDVLKASLNSACSSTTDAYGTSNVNKCLQNYLVDDMSIDTSYWLISGYSSESTSYSYFVYRVNHDSSGIYLTANYSSDTRNYM